nr:Ig-like domain-containing protein [Pantoea wallisii]
MTIYDGTSILGTATANESGNWSFTTPVLTEGAHSLTAVATDAAGNASPASAPLNFSVDTTAPAAAGDVLLSSDVGGVLVPVSPNGSISDNAPQLSGTAESGSVISIFDGETLLGSVATNADGSWSFTTPTLGEGAHTLTTTVTDAAGNTSSPSAGIVVTVDTVPPAVISNLVINADSGNNQGPLSPNDTTDDRTPTLSGTTEPFSQVSVYDGSTLLGVVAVDSSGNWSFTTPTLSNGAHNLIVSVTDAAGNVSATTPEFPLTVAGSAPVASAALEVYDESGNTLTLLSNGAITNDSTPLLSGVATANALVTIYDGTTAVGSITAGANGQWSLRLASLSDGVHSLRASFDDGNGNTVSSPVITITLDTSVPDAADDLVLSSDQGGIVTPIAAEGASGDNTPVLSGTAESGSVVTILDGTTVLGSVTVGSNGTWSFTSPALIDGNHSLTTTVTDAAGNVSAPSAPVTFTVDTTPPAAISDLLVSDDSSTPITSGGTTTDSTPTLSGTTEAGAVVSIYDGSTLLGTATAGSDGNWSFTSPLLTNGAHSLTTTVTDAAGNVSQPSSALDFTVDAGIPPTSELLVVADDSGAALVVLSNNDSTRDATPILSGRAEADVVVTLFNGTTEIGSVIAGSDGLWTFTPTELADGTYVFNASYTDGAGTLIESNQVTITIDTVAPVTPADVGLTDADGNTIPSGETTNTNAPVLNGTGEVGNTVTISDGNTVLGSTTVGGDGNWSFTTPPLSEGNHSLTSTQTDAAGNVSPPSAPVVVTVDTVPPAVPGNLQLSDADGDALAAGSVTNVAQPVLSGSAEPGSTITVSDGDTTLGTATAGADGSWSFTPPAALDEGNHSLTATVTDTAGNTGPASTPLVITIDTTPPAVVSDLLLSNDQSGTPVAIGNGVTNDTTPVLSGRAEPGSTVAINDGQTLLGTATVATDGSWSFTTPVLQPGDHSLTATVTDAAGNTGAPSAALPVTIDVASPAAPDDITLVNNNGTTPQPITSGSLTNDATPLLSGTAAAGSVVTVSDGTTVLGTAIVAEDGNWSFTPAAALGDGSHSLSATVTSPAGNTSAPSAPIIITVDTSAPAVASDLQLVNDNGDAPQPITSGGATNDTTPLFSGSAEAGSTLAIYDDGALLGTALVGSDGRWSFTPQPALEAGDHSLTTIVTDAAGNSGPASAAINFTIDLTTPPAAAEVVLTNDNATTPQPIANGSATNDTTPVLSGTAEAGSTVTVLDGNTVLGTLLVGSGGDWSFALPTLTQGAHSVTTTVTSPAGNVSEPSAAIDFTVDTVAPAAPAALQLANNEGATPVGVPSGGTTNDTTPQLSGSAEPDSLVIVRDNGVVIGSATAGADGSWSLTPETPLVAGSHSLTATVTDPAGNVGPASAPYTFTVDLTAPEAPVGVVLNNNEGGALVPIAAGGTTNDATPELTGSAAPGSIITIYNDDSTTPLGSVTVGADGTWLFVTGTLTDGDYSLSVTVTDAAGNVSDRSEPLTFSVDTAAPGPATGLLLTNNDVDPGTAITSGSSTNDNTPVLSGVAEPNSIITVYDGQIPIGTATAGDDGNWSFSPILTDGQHNLNVTVTDTAGNTSEPGNSISFTVITSTPPAVTDLTIANNNGSGAPVTIPNGGLTNDSTPLISGAGAPGSVVVIANGDDVLGTVTVGADGSWSFAPQTALADGSYTLTATTRDAAGNLSAPVTAQLVIDATPPQPATEITLSSDNGASPGEIPAGSTTSDNTPLLAGTAEAGSTVNVLDNGVLVGTAIADADGAWSFSVPTLSNTAHSLTVTVTDAAGNTGTPSAPINFTVDSQAPVQATLVVTNDNGPNQVIVPNGTLTNDNTPLLSGEAEPDSLVIIYDGDVILGSTTATAGGTWSFPSPALTDGAHTLTATVTDALGNVSAPSSSFTLQVDATPPQPVSGLLVQNDNDADNPATIANGGATNDNTPLLSGTGEPGALVNVFNGNLIVGSATVDADGNWSLNTNPLDNGTYNLSVVVSDAAGNASDPVSVGLTINTVAPDPVLTFNVFGNNGSTPLLVNDNGFTNDTTPVLRGTALAGATINLLQDGEVIGTAIADANGVWRFETSALDDGAYAFSVEVVDAAGNVSEPTGPITVNIDTVLPVAVTDLTVSDNVGGSNGELGNGAATDDNTPQLSGTAEAGSRVAIYDGDTLLGTALAGTGGAWTFTPAALNNGLHSFTVVVTDAAGNVGPASAAFDINVQADLPPATSTLQITDDAGGTLVTLADGAVTRDTTPTLSGLAGANEIIRIYDGTTNTEIASVTAGTNGQWSYTPTLTVDGVYSWYITAQSPGNDPGAPSDTITITLDTVAPAAVDDLVVSNDSSGTAVPITAGAFVNDNTPVLTGSTEPGGIVTIFDGSNVLGTAIANGDGDWTFTTPFLNQGPHALSVAVTDAAGNVGPATPALNFTIDSVAPAAPTLLITNDVINQPVPNGGYSRDATPTLSGTAEAGSSITIRSDGDILTTLTVPANGQWSYTPATALGEGPHVISASVTDAAGNVSGTTSATVIVDTVAPAAVTLNASNNEGSTPVAIPNGTTTGDATPLLSGTAQAGTLLTISEAGQVVASLTVGASGNWSYTSAALSDGSHTFSVIATDAAGNSSPPTTLTLNVDITPPLAATNIVVLNDANATVPAGGSTNDTTPTLRGNAEANGIVTVYDGNTVLGTATVDGTGAWTFTSPVLSNAAHSLSVTVTDAVGNVGPRTAPISITVDTTAPTNPTLVVTNDNTSATVPNGGYSNDSTPTLRGTAEANSTVIIREGTTVLGSVVTGGDGSWSFTVPGTLTLSDGSHTLSITATDAAGNVSGAVSSTLFVDTAIPAAITGLTAATTTAARR